MYCPACGHDRYQVLQNPRRFATYELRDVTCTKCRRQFVIRTVIESVHVVNPVTLNSDEVPISQFDERYREHCLGRGPHPKYGGAL
jgi:transcriptional regulator NrdR family protein